MLILTFLLDQCGWGIVFDQQQGFNELNCCLCMVRSMGTFHASSGENLHCPIFRAHYFDRALEGQADPLQGGVQSLDSDRSMCHAYSGDLSICGPSWAVMGLGLVI